MMNRRNRLRRAALVLALLVLAAIVTGVAASATKTVIPKQLTGKWRRNGVMMTVNSKGGSVGIGTDSARFSHVTAHRLTISGPTSISGAVCSGTGTYRWKIHHGAVILELKLTKIHDGCKDRVRQSAGVWFPVRRPLV
jgi:hypothetical protein